MATSLISGIWHKMVTSFQVVLYEGKFFVRELLSLFERFKSQFDG
jgi:hypothetical protein